MLEENKQVGSTKLTSNSISSHSPSEVETQLTLCDKKMDNLDVVVSTLEEKLSSVLRKETEAGVGPKDEVSLTPLASEIRKMGDFVETQTSRLQNILNRLEI